jgi:hypothetical protein
MQGFFFGVWESTFVTFGDLVLVRFYFEGP